MWNVEKYGKCFMHSSHNPYYAKTFSQEMQQQSTLKVKEKKMSCTETCKLRYVMQKFWFNIKNQRMFILFMKLGLELKVRVIGTNHDLAPTRLL